MNPEILYYHALLHRAECLGYSGRYDEAERDAKKLVKARVPEWKVRGHLQLFYIYETHGEFRRARKEVEKACEIAEKEGLIYDLSVGYYYLGRLETKRGNYSSALDYFGKGIELVEGKEDKKFLTRKACIYHETGMVYQRLGELDKALDYLKKAHEIQKRTGNKRGEAIVLNSLYIVYMGKGDRENAKKCLRQSLKIAEMVDYRKIMATVLNNLGVLSLVDGELHEALPFFNRALRMYEEMHSPHNEAGVHSNLGMIYLYMGDMKKAELHYEKAYRLRKKLNDVYGLLISLILMGEMYLLKGEYKKAKDMMEQATKITEEKNLRGFYPEVLVVEGKRELFEGRFSNAEKKFSLAQKIAEEQEEEESGFLARTYLLLSRALQKKGIKTSGIEELADGVKVLEQFNYVIMAYENIALLYLLSRNPEEAEKWVEKLKEKIKAWRCRIYIPDLIMLEALILKQRGKKWKQKKEKAEKEAEKLGIKIPSFLT